MYTVPLIHVSSNTGLSLSERVPGPCLNLKLSRRAFSFAARNPARSSALKSGAWRTSQTNESSSVMVFVIDVVVNQFMRRYVEGFLNGANQSVGCCWPSLLSFSADEGVVDTTWVDMLSARYGESDTSERFRWESGVMLGLPEEYCRYTPYPSGFVW